MQTIHLQLQDDLYDEIVNKGIDIESVFREFLSFIVEDQYPEITTQEAKSRVKNAVDRYKNGSGTYINQDEYKQYINNQLKNLKSKYADNQR